MQHGLTDVVRLRGVTKRFTGHTAVQDLSLVVPRGAVYGLLGPNGAGKTTTIRMILNILVPDSGTIELFGLERSSRQVSQRVGYLPEERGLYRKMRVLDLLVFLAETKGLDRGVARTEGQRWLSELGLDRWARRKIDELSKGMQQKVQFISTVLHGPDLLILDEPFAGLDPVNAQVIKDTVVALAQSGTTVLFSTHIMEQAEKLCDAVCIIAGGQKVIDGSLTDVKRQRGGRHVIVAVERGGKDVDRLLRDSTAVTKVDHYGPYAEVELTPDGDPQQLLRALVESGAGVTRFEITEPTLHKVFLDLVAGDGPAAPRRTERSHA